MKCICGGERVFKLHKSFICADCGREWDFLIKKYKWRALNFFERQPPNHILCIGATSLTKAEAIYEIERETKLGYQLIRLFATANKAESGP